MTPNREQLELFREAFPHMLFYKIDETGGSGLIPVSEDDPLSHNTKPFAIFGTVNQFRNHQSRSKDQVLKYKAVFVDIDKKPWEFVQQRIEASPLEPTAVVKSKNGVHLWWAIEPLESNTEIDLRYKDILDWRLGPFFQSDPKARLQAQLLRVPGSIHWKDPEDPVVVELEYLDSAVGYRLSDFESFFPRVSDDRPKHVRDDRVFGDTPRARLHSMDQMQLLERFSGTKWVAGEQYTFKPTANDKFNIVVDGQSTSCFVDEFGLIGANPGGPTLWKWLRYFGWNEADIETALRQLVPEIWKEKT